jgi:fructose/tagatose bisphosphate aldolase
MPLVPFSQLMKAAQRGGYAVGYFESWNLESLLSVADAAEAMRSPVLLGFSGIYLPHPARLRTDSLEIYAAIGLEVCRNLSVPACLVFNESPHMSWVLDAIRLGIGLVMFSDETLAFTDQIDYTRRVVEAAHQKGLAVEGEAFPIPGVGGELDAAPIDARMTDIIGARLFIGQTGVDAFAVNLGQVHLHGKQEVHLDLDRLKLLQTTLDLPLVLHGSSSVYREDLRAAIQLGIRKVNVGSALKQVYFQTLKEACNTVDGHHNPYEIIGSGLSKDVLMAGRLALQGKVEEYMRLFGSAGQAGGKIG